MKRIKISDLLAGLAALALAAVAVLLWSQAQSLAQQAEANDEKSQGPESRVVSVMQRMEVQVERLYYSGRDQEWDQAKQGARDSLGGGRAPLRPGDLLWGYQHQRRRGVAPARGVQAPG